MRSDPLSLEHSTSRPTSRRRFLRGVGVVLSLPFLESFGRSPRQVFGAEEPAEKPRRLLAICNNLGLLPDRFFPSDPGENYELSPYLEELAAQRDDFTVFSGVSHPGVDGSHSSDVSFLTAAPHPGGGGFRNSISLDQVVASHLGHLTRFPSLTLGVNAKEGRRSLSWTDAGVLIPCEDSASSVYARLFLQGSKKEVDRQVRRLLLGKSILDAVRVQANDLLRRVSISDRDRIDQYTTAVRDLEKRLTSAREWERRPKPEPSASPPVDPSSPSEYMAKTRLMYDMARLAFETDSTRSITILLDSNNSAVIKVAGTSITDGYHNLSHHGKSADKLAQLDAIDRAHLRLLGGLLDDLRAVDQAGSSLLDRTMVLYGSNLGDANKHTTTNLPVLLAGGGFQHGRHLAFERGDNYPLPRLFVSMLQRLGIETDHFASTTGTMRGLDFTG